MTKTDIVKAPTAADKALQKAHRQGTMVGMKHTEVQSVLEKMKIQIAQALPKHLTVERQIQICTTLISRNPKIAECTLTSLVGAVVEASILGFKPTPSLGECYFVPYNRNIGTRSAPKWVKEVQLQIGYRGYINLARRSKELKTIFAECVYADDEFRYEMGLEPKLKHKPKMDSDKNDNDLRYVYAVAHYKDGGYNFVVLTKKQVENLRMRNPAQKPEPSGAWKSDYSEMAKAKVIKKLAKYLPLNEDSDEPSLTRGALVDEQTVDINDFNSSGSGIPIETIRSGELTTDIPEADVEEPVDTLSSPPIVAPNPPIDMTHDGKLGADSTVLDSALTDEGKKAVSAAEAVGLPAETKKKALKKTVKKKTDPLPEPTIEKLMADEKFVWDEEEGCWEKNSGDGWCIVQKDGKKFNVYYGTGDEEAEVDDTVEGLMGVGLMLKAFDKYCQTLNL